MSASLSVSLGARWAPDQGVGLVQPACPALATPHWPSTCISIWNCSTGMPEPAPGQRFFSPNANGEIWGDSTPLTRNLARSVLKCKCRGLKYF